jgi:beta-galactosidase
MWYQLCSEHGIYVFDEANVETHGAGWQRENYLAGNVLWRGTHVNRVRRMIERDKNLPCVIVWSLGNEAGTGDNLKRAYEFAKRRDGSRPVVYDFDGGDGYTDILFPMYTLPSDLDAFVRGAPGLGGVYGATNRHQPLILCEYAHAMGNSLGNFAEYWEVINRHKVLGGGFIWDWVDQALLAPRPSIGNIMAYGGDFGPPDTPTDQNFLINGLVMADRRPSPQVWEMKKQYEPVLITGHWTRAAWDMHPRGLPSHVDIHSRKIFGTLDEVATVMVLVRANGRVTVETVVDAAALAQIRELMPGATVRIQLPIVSRFDAGVEYVVELQLWRARTTVISRLLPDGATTHGPTGFGELAWWQSPPHVETLAQPMAPSGDVLQLDEVSSGRWSVTGSNFRITFSCKTGQIEDWHFAGKQLTLTPSTPDFWRAPTDNDYGCAFKCMPWPILIVSLLLFCESHADTALDSSVSSLYIPSIYVHNWHGCVTTAHTHTVASEALSL